jgi:lysyl-tRNA synthetase class 2
MSELYPEPAVEVGVEVEAEAEAEAELSSKHKQKITKKDFKKNAKKDATNDATKDAVVEVKKDEDLENDVEDYDKYYNMRVEEMDKLKKNGINPYPHKYSISMSFDKFVETYNSLETAQHLEDKNESLAGRIMAIRSNSNKLWFMTVKSNGCTMQFAFNKNYYYDQDKFVADAKSIARGDIVGVEGFPAKTKSGELSLFVRRVQILTPCLRTIPKTIYGIKDEDTRSRKRFLDMIANEDSIKTILTRSKIIRFIRKYLDDLDFTELQTPILCTQVGGASAKPFKTYLNDHKMDMCMRIATELPLKMAIVGGLDAVYDLGSQFRNENLDCTHHPEFTSIELYQTYRDYNNMMDLCEDLLSKLAFHIKGSYKFSYLPLHAEKEIELDFTPPFRRLDLVTEIEKHTDTKLPEDLGTDESRLILLGLCDKFGVECSDPKTNARLLDKLVGHFLEPQCSNPTFIMNHPLMMSPLAKWHRDKPFLTERFELFINCFEIANAYTELNDPFVQRKTFEDQMKAKNAGDEEAQGIDELFIEALEYGLPPCGGLGIGADRVVMLLTNKNKIKDVILFPIVKND